MALSTKSSQVIHRATRSTPPQCSIFESVTVRQRRRMHSSRPARIDVSASPLPVAEHSAARALPTQRKPSGLAALPLSQILRTYLITSVSSSPTLLNASSNLLRRLIDSDNTLTSLEKNPVLRALLWETFYKQFCAGETGEQISSSCDALRQQGYAGVILEYALEVLKDAEGSEVEDVANWKRGILRSIEIAAPGDFVGLKWSGMGAAALRRLAAAQDPSPAMHDAMSDACEAAAAKGIALLPAAEETSTLQGYFAWTLMMQRQFNRSGKSTIYNTYQAYLRQTPDTLSKHLAIAKAEDFTLGAKLVRGAYLSSEPKNLLHPSIQATHAAYDRLASAMIQRGYNDVVQPASGASRELPQVNVMLATHNAESVRKARKARQKQADQSQELTPLYFAQLQGMADEVSCTLLANESSPAKRTVVEKVFKCTTWGTMTECLNYLLRRAAENKDAASRTSDSRRAMQSELFRRMRSTLTPA